jgi:phage baseplate assembly protein W
MSTHFPFPYQIDARGLTAARDDDRHIRDLIEQLLFTAPGERVNRPDFGSGIKQLLFAPNSTELAAATRFMLQGGLQRYLGEVIEVTGLDVEPSEASLVITVRYRARYRQEERSARFAWEV